MEEGIDGTVERRTPTCNFAFEELWGLRCVFLFFGLFTYAFDDYLLGAYTSQAGISFCL